MRTFRRLEIEILGSDAFGLGVSNRTTIRQLANDSAESYEAGSDATTKVFLWLKANYFGYDLLRKQMVNDFIDQLRDKDLAELVKRVLKDERASVGAAQSSGKR